MGEGVSQKKIKNSSPKRQKNGFLSFCGEEGGVGSGAQYLTPMLVACFSLFSLCLGLFKNSGMQNLRYSLLSTYYLNIIILSPYIYRLLELDNGHAVTCKFACRKLSSAVDVTTRKLHAIRSLVSLFESVPAGVNYRSERS